MATVREFKATARPKSGKGAARAERRAGRTPAVIYGDNKPPMPISLDHVEVRNRIYAGRFLTTIFDIEVDGTKHRVLPRDFQLDPVKDYPIHVDFLRLGEGATIRVSIPVHVIGAEASPGVKRGGAVNIVAHAVDVVVPADAIPTHIDVDVSTLEINHSKHLNEIDLPPGVKPLRPEQTLVTIVPPSGYAEEQRSAADAASGAAATAAAATPAAGTPAAGGGAGGAKK